MDPCQDLTDEDIRTAIQNATGTRNALFVPEVSFIIIIYVVPEFSYSHQQIYLLDLKM